MKKDMSAGKKPKGGFSSFVHIKKPKFECRSSNTRINLPDDIVFKIILWLPAESVARFRCVSTAWLSTTTDPSFILAHTRCAQKFFIVRSILFNPNNHPYNQLFSFNTSDSTICREILYPIYDLASSSCDGLVLFLRKEASHHPSGRDYFVMNPLIQQYIDLPQSNTSKRSDSRMELYYHRWTGVYRLLYLSRCIKSDVFYMDAEVLSLGSTNTSWRQIKAKAPVVTSFYFNNKIQMNDHLYWVFQESILIPPSILVFDILKETFSLMELPSYNQKLVFSSFAHRSNLKYGLVDMEGILCFWIVYRDKNCIKNAMIDIWEVVDGNEKWKNTYSLCLAEEFPWELIYPYNDHIFADSCLCIKGRELLFLFTDPRPCGMKGKYEQHMQYFFYWNLKSGKYRTKLLPSGFATLKFPTLIYSETLVNPPPLSHATLTLAGSPT